MIEKKNDKSKQNQQNDDNKANLSAKLIKALSVQENFKAIISQDSVRPLPSIDGFRAISIVWITLGHTFFFTMSSIDNFKFGFLITAEWLIQLVYASILIVDVFFVLCGFLHAYNLSEQQKRNPSKNLVSGFLGKIVKRYLQTFFGFGIVSSRTLAHKSSDL